MEWEIGSTVRVDCGGYSRRGIIAYVNSPLGDMVPLDDKIPSNANCPSFDIIYLDNTEESSVISSRVSSLLDLEYICNQYQKQHPSPGSDPQQFPPPPHNNPHEMVQLLKLCGNSLFELKDYDGAYEYYLKGHHLMTHLQELSVGSRVLIQTQASYYVVGMISGVSSVGMSKTYEVIYDELVNDNDEEDNVSPDRLVAVYEITEAGDRDHTETSDKKKELGLELQRSIFLNLSKCATKRQLKGWAVRWALLAVGLLQGDLAKFPKEKHGKLMSDAFYVLSKAFINSSRPHLAKNAALELKSIESRYTALPVRSTQVLKEIETFKNQKQKENKVLAKNIAEWVDTAMREGEKARVAAASGVGKEPRGLGGGEDLELCDDIGADEIGQTSSSVLSHGSRGREGGRGSGGGEEEMKSSSSRPLGDREEGEEKGECLVM